MTNTYSTLKGVNNLGVLSDSPLSQVNQVGLTNRDDFYRFTLGNRGSFDLKLAQIAKGANVDVELYAPKRPWTQVVRQIGKLDFRKLSATARNANLQWIDTSKQTGNTNESIVGDLAPGDYCIRVLQRTGKSRYRLNLKATPIIPPPDIISSPSPNTTPPTNSTPNIPPSRPPASGNGYSVTGTDETNIRAQFNLYSTTLAGSVIQDEAEADPKVGLFSGAIEDFVSGRGRLSGINSSAIVTPFTPDPSGSGVKFAVLNLRADLVYDAVQQKGTLEYKIFQEGVKDFRLGVDKTIFGLRFNLDANFSKNFDLDRSVNSLDYIVKNNLLGDSNAGNGKSSGIGFSDYAILQSNSSASGVEGGTVLTSKSTTPP